MLKLTCNRCGYTWIPRVENVKQCPGCRSCLWNKERVREVRIKARRRDEGNTETT